MPNPRYFYTGIDLTGNQLINVIVEVLASRPATNLVAGRLIYNSTSGKLEYYTGSTWVTLDNSGGNASTLNGQLPAYYLARANHAGTQLAATISDFNAAVHLNRLDQLAAPTSAVALNAQKISGLADPTLAQDAATLAYVSSRITSLINGAPAALDTLAEIATAINNDAAYNTTIQAAITAAKARANHTGSQLAATISDLSTAVDARHAAWGYAQNLGNGTLTTFTVNHNLATRDIDVRVMQAVTPWAFVEPDIVADTVNSVQISFATAPASNAYRALIHRVL
jgi:hypothetical protein